MYLSQHVCLLLTNRGGSILGRRVNLDLLCRRDSAFPLLLSPGDGLASFHPKRGNDTILQFYSTDNSSILQAHPFSASALLTSNNTDISTLAKISHSYPASLSSIKHSLNMDSSPGKCCVCMERPPFGEMTNASKDNVCHDCIRQTFQRALDYEGNYPPKWGNHILDIRKYTQQRILTQEFLGRYHQKEREYRCPSANRIYCSWPRNGTVQQADDEGKGIDKGKAIDDRCNTFLGARIRSTVDVLGNNGELVVRCKECHNLSCRACETHIHGLAQAMNHKCLPVRAADPDDAAFQGLKRGKDFQLCPFEECERKIELNDGCNHIRCPCGMQFCFICGQPAMEGSGHWSRMGDTEPGCPRWNQPGVSAS
jgi:hypothetical protein